MNKVNNTTDFTDYPLSVGEQRAKTKDNGKIWTPRDALISMLRRIDSGEVKPEALIICIREDHGEFTRTYFSNAAADVHTSLGLLEHIKHRLLTD